MSDVTNELASALQPGTVRFLHVPRTGGTSIVRAWGLDATGEWQGHVVPRKRPADFCYAFVRNPWERAVSLWRYFHPDRGVRFPVWVDRGMPPERMGGGEAARIVCAPMVTWTRWADWVGRFERRDDYLVELAAMLGRPVPDLHLNPSVGFRAPWRSVYSVKAHDTVADIFGADIEQWGYEFAPASAEPAGAS